MFVLFKKIRFSKKGFLTLFLLFFIIFSILIISNSALADTTTVNQDALKALDKTAIKAQITKELGVTPSTESIIGSVINMALGLLGLVFFLLIIYGGITWMTASGNEERSVKARKILIRSSIGIIIIASAYLIANLIIFRLLEIATT